MSNEEEVIHICMSCLNKLEEQKGYKHLHYSIEKNKCKCGVKTNFWYEE